MNAKIHSVENGCFHINKSNPPELVVHASGMTNSSGWKNGQLVPYTYVVQPEDGILDFDFLATPPDGVVLWVMTPITAEIRVQLDNWVRGIRIHSSSNNLEIMLDDTCSVESTLSSRDVWPWPWIIKSPFE